MQYFRTKGGTVSRWVLTGQLSASGLAAVEATGAGVGFCWCFSSARTGVSQAAKRKMTAIAKRWPAQTNDRPLPWRLAQTDKRMRLAKRRVAVKSHLPGSWRQSVWSYGRDRGGAKQAAKRILMRGPPLGQAYLPFYPVRDPFVGPVRWRFGGPLGSRGGPRRPGAGSTAAKVSNFPRKPLNKRPRRTALTGRVLLVRCL